MADDEPAGPKLTDQRRDRHEGKVNPHPGRIGVQFENDQRREHRRQHAANRATGFLLQKHRHDGDQHVGQMPDFLWVEPFQPKGRVTSTSRSPGGNESPTAGAVTLKQGPSVAERARGEAANVNLDAIDRDVDDDHVRVGEAGGKLRVQRARPHGSHFRRVFDDRGVPAQCDVTVAGRVLIRQRDQWRFPYFGDFARTPSHQEAARPFIVTLSAGLRADYSGIGAALGGSRGEPAVRNVRDRLACRDEVLGDLFWGHHRNRRHRRHGAVSTQERASV